MAASQRRMKQIKDFKHKPLTAAMLVALGMPLGAPLGAMAQDATAPAASTSTNATVEEQTLKEVQVQDSAFKGDVTSPKFTAPLLDTPQVINIIPKEVIRERGATSLVDVLRAIPGVTMTAGEGGTPVGDNVRIRGFDAEADVFIDGIRDQGSQSRDIFDIEQVEVSKGPSSTLTGAGAIGGSVNIVTKKPELENYVSGSVGLGTSAYKRATIDTNYKLSDHSAFRLNMLEQKADVAGRNGVDLFHKGFAPSLAFGLGTDTRVNLDYYWYRTDDMPDYGIPYSRNAGNTAAAGEPVKVNRNTFYGLVNRDFQRTAADIGTVKIEHDLTSKITLRNTTRYGQTKNNFLVSNPDDSFGNVPYGYVLRGVKARNSRTTTMANVTDVSGQFDLASIKNTFDVGVELMQIQTDERGYISRNSNGNIEGSYQRSTAAGFPGANSCPVLGVVGSNYDCTTLNNPNPYDPWTGTVSPAAAFTSAQTTNKAIYGLDTLQFTPQWLLNVGLRYDHYYTQQNSYASTVANAVQGQAGNSLTLTSLDSRNSFLSYQVGIVYKPLPNGSVYVSTATSSDPPGLTLGDGTDNISAANQNTDPQKTKTYEVGTKWDVLNRRLSLTADVFLMRMDNARMTDPNNTSLQINAGTQQVKGFELGATGSITKEWRVFGGYTFLKSEIKNDGTAADKGNDFPNTPKNSFNLSTDYTFFNKLMVGGSAYFVDKRYGNTANTLWVDGYWRFDAMAGYTINKNVSLQLNVLNLTNKVYYDRPFTTHYAAIAPGRSAMVTANFRF